ncbi:MAG: hypothetical protein JEZ08_17635 [Clostridiales bacterium]|nr:hypothetical protein [Clostridiales bacterium]
MCCSWLPEFYDYPVWAEYDKYEMGLFDEFLNVYKNKPIYFTNERVSFKRKPEYLGKDESFYHMTCRKFEVDKRTGEILERDPDPERMIRIRWSRAIIENHLCNNGCCMEPYYWTKVFKNGNLRHKIYKDQYLVILEEREDYFLFVTGYYVDDYRVKRLLQEYKKCI